jgi:L-fuconolactonase
MLHRRSFLASALATAAGASLPKAVVAAALAPFKLYDAHAHFYSDNPEKYPFKSDITPVAKAKAMAHPMTDGVMLEMWDEAGVERGCGVQYNTTYFTDNRYLLDMAAKHPTRIAPIVILSPTDTATPATLARMAQQNHICGVRFAGLPDDAGNYVFLSDAAKPAWAAANDLGLVVVLMPLKPEMPNAEQVLPRAMARIAELADRYPRVNIVLDHLGFPEAVVSPTFGLSPEHLALKSHKNIYYKYTNYLMGRLEKGGVSTKDFLHYAVKVYGADHFVWGSDQGNTEGPVAKLAKAALASAEGLPLAQQKSIFHDTAEGLFIPGGHPRTRT